MDKDKAMVIAQRYLAGMSRRLGVEYVLLASKTRRLENGWTFAYQSRLFMETGDAQYKVTDGFAIAVGDGYTGTGEE